MSGPRSSESGAIALKDAEGELDDRLRRYIVLFWEQIRSRIPEVLAAVQSPDTSGYALGSMVVFGEVSARQLDNGGLNPGIRFASLRELLATSSPNARGIRDFLRNKNSSYALRTQLGAVAWIKYRGSSYQTVGWLCELPRNEG